MKDYDEMKDYHVFQWRSCMSLSVEHFKTLLRVPEIGSEFDKEFPVRIGERARELQRLGFRCDFLLLPLMLLLGAFNSELIATISIFGVSLSKNNATFSVLLLISSIFWILSSAVSTTASYYCKLLEGYISIQHDDRIAHFYIQQFQWDMRSIFSAETSELNISHNIFTATVMAIWVISAIFGGVIIKILMLLIFAGATISNFETSDIPNFINLPIVSLAVCAIVFDITCLLVQCPLPFTDKSNIEKLIKLDQTDPDLADEIRMKIAANELRKGRKNSILLQSIVLTLFVIAPTWFTIGNDLFTKYEVVLQVLLGLAFMLIIVSPLIDRIEGKILSSIFKIEDKQLSITRYVFAKNWVWRGRLILSAAIGLGVYFWQQ